MHTLVKAKLYATLVHGFLTLIVAVFTAFLVYRLWYPAPFAQLTGGTDLFLLVLGVEVVLGPVMSLVIFNPVKVRKEMVRDYLVVGLIQFSALSYGIYSVYLARPVYVVFVKDRLDVVVAAELDAADMHGADDGFTRLPLLGPKTICVDYPADPQERSELLWSAVQGKDIQLQPRYYRDCEQGEVRSHAYGRDQLEKLTQIKRSSLPLNVGDQDFSWLPVVSRFGSWIVIFVGDSDTRPVYVNANPFAKTG